MDTISGTYGEAAMNENKFAPAGWLSILCAVLFPLGFLVSIIQGIIGARMFGYRGQTFGPSDMIFIAVTIIGVYVLLMLRRLLHERYEFHDADLMITLAIIWNILFQAGSIFLRVIALTAGFGDELAFNFAFFIFLAVSMLCAGAIDIIFAVLLFRIKDIVGNLFKAYIIITLISGILSFTVILTPLALLLAPVSFVMLGLIFLREKEEVEFV